ncbi:hydrolase [Paenibacillus sp. SYP-B3998]|uniref:Hydrolase n=1 Tax=Paenibacillus sp. SYP-B3998 TaxID=2678564 RepID=A0A6G3ZUU7_9BACL|nr:hydrolase [Paenibacillus sp. SYP-B3998]
MRKIKIFVWATSAVIIVIAAAIFVQWNTYTPSDFMQKKIKSGNLSVDYSIDQALLDVDRLSLNAVNVPVMILVDNLDASTMKVDQGSLQKAKAVIKKLKKRKIAVILEPYPWIAAGEKYETDWNPSDVNRFFDNWTHMVLKELIDKVAVPERVDVLMMASNLRYLEPYDEQWVKTADEVRKHYQGFLTYKTNWWFTAEGDESSKREYRYKLNSQFLSMMDYISIGSYFELSDQPVNTVEQLKEALYASKVYNRRQPIVEEIEQLHQRWNKPIFLGELGFPKRNYAAKHPWNPSPSDVYNGEEQARGFEAYRQVFTQDWFLGFSVFAIGETGDDKHYYPSEESAAVIKKWFK